MKRTLAVLIASLVCFVSIGRPAAAQEPPKEQVPLKLDLVISRQAGDKKIASMPYSLWVTANAPGRASETSLRMGVQVPVPVNVIRSPKEGEPLPSGPYNYRDVGTNIDCSASTTSDGRFGITITLNNTSVDEKAMSQGGVVAPAFRNFTSRFYILLRDGQTATYTSATDPVTGETLKVDVTLTVLK